MSVRELKDLNGQALKQTIDGDSPAMAWEKRRFPLLSRLLDLSNERDDIEDRLADIKDERRLIRKQLQQIGPSPQ